MEGGFWLGMLMGIVAGSGSAWYFKVLPLQQSILAMTGEYRKAERSRKILQKEKSGQY